MCTQAPVRSAAGEGLSSKRRQRTRLTCAAAKVAVVDLDVGKCQPATTGHQTGPQAHARLTTNSSALPGSGQPGYASHRPSTPIRPRHRRRCWRVGRGRGAGRLQAAGGRSAAEHEQHEVPAAASRDPGCRVTAAIVAGRACSRRIGGTPFTTLAGIDFTSRPSAASRSPAIGRSDGAGVRLARLDRHVSFESFAAWLRAPGPAGRPRLPPFGLPRELAER